MSDLIDRQAAIDAFNKELSAEYAHREMAVSFLGAKKIIETVPSAQPEIIRCKDCKWFGDIGCAIRIVDDSDNPTENDFCSFAERRIDE